MFAPMFDLNEPVSATKGQFLELAKAGRSTVWEPFSIEINRSEIMNYKEYFVKQSTNEVTDLKLYNPFYFQYATDNLSDESPYLGELWVEYDIELISPITHTIQRTILQDYNNFFQMECSNVQNDSFGTVAPFGGGLKMEVLGNNRELRNTSGRVLTGMFYYQINVSNLGLANKFFDNPPEWSAVVAKGNKNTFTIVPQMAVGGNSRGGEDDSFIVVVYGFTAMQPGDTLYMDRMGFYPSGDPDEVADHFSFFILVGENPAAPVIP